MKFACPFVAAFLSALGVSGALAQESDEPRYQFFDGEFEASTQALCFDPQSRGLPHHQYENGHLTTLCQDDDANMQTLEPFLWRAWRDVAQNGGALPDIHSLPSVQADASGVPNFYVYYGESKPWPEVGGECFSTRWTVLAGVAQNADNPLASGVMVWCQNSSIYQRKALELR